MQSPQHPATPNAFLSVFDWSKRNVHMDGLPLMSSFWPILVICSSYVYLVKFAGLSFMSHREPYNVRQLMVIYNGLQVMISCLLMYFTYTFGFFGDYNWICQSTSGPFSNRYHVQLLLYFGFLLRLLDFADTFFFLAQKKFSHISNLQVFHHFTVPLMGWLGIRYFPDGNYLAAAFLNTGVHIVMYSYYFLAALGPKYCKYLWWKKYLTMLQIGQFVIVMLKHFPIMVGWIECPESEPWQFWIVGYIYGIVLLLMFSHYYIKAYVAVDRTKFKKM